MKSPQEEDNDENNVILATMERRNSIVKERLRLKDRILESVGRAIKQLQEYQFCNGFDTVTLHNEDRLLKKLCEHLDHALLHGLRHITNGYWQLAKYFTRKEAVKEIDRLTKVTTDLGKGRAWLYMALNENLLECYMKCITENSKVVRKYYVKESLLLDDQRLQILMTMTSGLEFVRFELEYDMPYLDLSSYMPNARRSVDEYDDERLSLSSMSSEASLTSSMMSDSLSSRSVFENDTHSVASSSESSSRPYAYSASSENSRLASASDFTAHSRTSSIDSLLKDNNNVDSTAIGDALEVIRVKRKKKKRKGSDPPTPTTPSTASDSPLLTSLNEFSIKEENPCEPKSPKSKQNILASDSQDSGVGEVPTTSDSQDSGMGGEEPLYVDPLAKHVRAVFQKRQIVRGNSPTTTAGDDTNVVTVHKEELSRIIDVNFCPDGEERSEADGDNQLDDNNRRSATGGRRRVDVSDIVRSLSESPRTSGSVVVAAGEPSADSSYSSHHGSPSVSMGTVQASPRVANGLVSAGAPVPNGPVPASPPVGNGTFQANSPPVHASPSVGGYDADFISTLSPSNSVVLSSSMARPETRGSVDNDLDTASAVCGGNRTTLPVVAVNASAAQRSGGVDSSWNDIYSASYQRNEINNDFDDLMVDRRSYYDDRSVGGNRDDIDGSIVINAPEDDLTVDAGADEIDDSLVAIQNGLLMPLLRGEGDGASQGSLDDRNLLTGDGRQVIGSSETSSPDSTSSQEWDIKVDNNTMLYLMLDVFQEQDEQFHKMYRTSVGHTESECQTVFLLLTDQSLYLLVQGLTDIRYHREAVIKYRELDFISLSLNYQMINIVCTNRRKQFWITTGDEQLTKSFLSTLDQILRQEDLNLPRLSVLTDATTQKITLRKWLASECRCQVNDVEVLRYTLVHWEDPGSSSQTCMHNHTSKEGILLYKDHSSFLLGSIWKAAYFVLKDGVLYQYDDQQDSRLSVPKLCLPLSSEECSGCRRNPNNDRQYCFDVILTNGTATLQLSAPNDGELQSWLMALCQAVADGINGSQQNCQACLPCCGVLTNAKLIMCQEDVQTNFFRTLGSANITDITSVYVDNGAKSYCILEFESQENTVSSAKWVLYFNSELEREKYIQSLSSAWESYFQVAIPVQLLDDVCLQRKCRENIAILKRPQFASHMPKRRAITK
ncbi:pleckstrin homology domain-containing family M member 2-like [Tubulanus polymorphus]|uniref:pleckstrin homology domain-containing family M member 2-like n=1 Tax=Tubulanus polymorphus TaxID=672921 RepID=UPI003DA6A8DF